MKTINGFFFGLESDYGKGYFVGKSSELDGNAIAIGINGSGKSLVIAKSATETWREPFVVLDIKGELADHYTTLYREGLVKRPYIVFDPGKRCGCYNVYSLLQKDDPHFVQYVQDISNAIIPMPPDARESAYWINMARNMLSATIIFFHAQGFDFIETIVATHSTSIHKLCREINRQGCPMAKAFISEVGGLKPEQKSSIATELKRHTMVFATDAYIQAALSRDSETGDTPLLVG